MTISGEAFEAVIFDLDGVITDTARVHETAWRALFEDYLRGRDREDPEFSHQDYLRYVDGRPRIDGVETFLASRGIELPRGDPSDPGDAPTAWGLANRKNRLFLESLASQGAEVFPDSVETLERVRSAGLRTAVVTASRNRAEVLEAVGMADAFDAAVDGIVAAELGLPGKPDPATFLEAARRLGVAPGRAVVIEDAISGIEAGRRGRFGLVVGVARTGHGEELLEHGAHLVVDSLSLLEVEGAGGTKPR